MPNAMSKRSFSPINDVIANVEATAEVPESIAEISTGMGLAIIGAGIPTGLSTSGAGIAVGPSGAASLAAIIDQLPTVHPYPPLFYMGFHYWLKTAGSNELAVRFAAAGFATLI